MIQKTKTIIGIAGPTASGKTSVTAMLVSELGAVCFRPSAILAEMAREKGLPEDKATLQQLYVDERVSRGEDFLAILLRERVLQSKASLVVVEGNRRKADLDSLHTLAQEQNVTLKLLFIDASPHTRFERINMRQETIGEAPLSREAFDTLEQHPAENEIDDLRKAFAEEGTYINTDNLSPEEVCALATKALILTK